MLAGGPAGCGCLLAGGGPGALLAGGGPGALLAGGCPGALLVGCGPGVAPLTRGSNSSSNSFNACKYRLIN